MKKKQPLKIKHSTYPDGTKLDWDSTSSYSKSRHTNTIYVIITLLIVLLITQLLHIH